MLRNLAVVAVVLLLASPVMAQDSTSGYNWYIVGGIGAGVPARDDGFTSNADVGFYRVLQLEFAVSDRLRLYGRYDRATFDAIQGDEYDATTLGGGVLYWFDIKPKNNFRGAFKLGGSKVQEATPMIPDPSWEPDFGMLIEGHFKGNATIRAGADLTTFQNSDRIQAIRIYIAVAAGLEGLWK